MGAWRPTWIPSRLRGSTFLLLLLLVSVEARRRKVSPACAAGLPIFTSFCLTQPPVRIATPLPHPLSPAQRPSTSPRPRQGLRRRPSRSATSSDRAPPSEACPRPSHHTCTRSRTAAACVASCLSSPFNLQRPGPAALPPLQLVASGVTTQHTRARTQASSCSTVRSRRPRSSIRTPRTT